MNWKSINEIKIQVSFQMDIHWQYHFESITHGEKAGQIILDILESWK